MHGVYGTVPDGLVDVPEAAAQFSPTLPGAAALETAARLASLTMLAPAGTLERRHAVALALRALKPGGELIVLAANNRGGKRLREELARFGLEPAIRAKAHFQICSGARPVLVAELDEALAAGGQQYVSEIGLWSQPGVFSWNEIDPGSRLLTQHLPVLKGRGADLGCGIGYLARTILASADVESLALVDIDRRALAAAKRNIADPRAGFLWADAALALPLVTPLDFVVSNPPFHRDGQEDRALGLGFVRQASGLLRGQGEFWLVVNRHLPYLPALNRDFSSVSCAGETNEYKVYRAIK